VLVTNDESGAVVLMQPDTKQKPVGTLDEGEIIAAAKAAAPSSAPARRSGPPSFRAETASTTTLSSAKAETLRTQYRRPPDSSVPAIRTMTYDRPNYTDPNNTKDTAAWRRSLQVAKSMTFPSPSWAGTAQQASPGRRASSSP